MKRPELVLKGAAVTIAFLIGNIVIVEAMRKPQTVIWCIEGEAHDGNLQSGIEEAAKRHGVYLGEGVAETLGRTIEGDIALRPHEQVGSQPIWIGLGEHQNPITAGPGDCVAGLPQPTTRPS